MSDKKEERLLTTKEAARFLNKSPDTLAVWRSTRRYTLKAVKRFGKVYYKESDLVKFLEDQTRPC